MLRQDSIGQTVSICGWVDRNRNLGGLLFLDIRDHTGILQVVSEDTTTAESLQTAERLRREWVVCVTGELRQRKDPNPKLETGEVELVLGNVQVLNSVNRTLPFPISEAEEQEPPRCALPAPSPAAVKHTMHRLQWQCSPADHVMPPFARPYASIE
jgi:aspartyl-tRNA synthetase